MILVILQEDSEGNEFNAEPDDEDEEEGKLILFYKIYLIFICNRRDQN